MRIMSRLSVPTHQKEEYNKDMTAPDPFGVDGHLRFHLFRATGDAEANWLMLIVASLVHG